MNRLAEAVERSLRRRGWDYLRQGADGPFLVVGDLDAAGRTEMRVRAADECVFFDAKGRVRVPEEARDAACLYLARENYGLREGCLIMDPEAGELGCRAWLCAGARTPGAEEIDRFLDFCLMELERGSEGLQRALYGEEDWD